MIGYTASSLHATRLPWPLPSCWEESKYVCGLPWQSGKLHICCPWALRTFLQNCHVCWGALDSLLLPCVQERNRRALELLLQKDQAIAALQEQLAAATAAREAADAAMAAAEARAQALQASSGWALHRVGCICC